MSQPPEQAVITGGEGDLACALAEELAQHGLQVNAPGRDELNVADAASISAYFGSKQPDLLICNAAITRDRPLACVSETDWDEVMAVNLRGAMACARQAIAAMQGRAGGHVIFLSSFSALHPPIGQAAYATAKAALLGLVSDLAVRHGERNIRINAILPGFLDTRMTAAVTDERRQQVIAHHALGRLNTPDRVAAFIRFLHLELLHTSGQVFHLDSRPVRW